MHGLDVYVRVGVGKYAERGADDAFACLGGVETHEHLSACAFFDDNVEGSDACGGVFAMCVHDDGLGKCGTSGNTHGTRFGCVRGEPLACGAAHAMLEGLRHVARDGRRCGQIEVHFAAVENLVVGLGVILGFRLLGARSPRGKRSGGKCAELGFLRAFGHVNLDTVGNGVDNVDFRFVHIQAMPGGGDERVGAQGRRGGFDHYPIAPSISSLMRLFISTAYSSGSSLLTGSAKPLTTMVRASSSEIPRLIR